MRSRVLGLAPALAAAALAGATAVPAASRVSCAGAGARPTPARAVAVSGATLCLLNRERVGHGLRPLRSNPLLALAARRHSLDMVRHGFFAHGDLVARLVHAGYFRGRRSWTVGENIAWGTGSQSTPRSIVRLWMHSPGHRANILNGRFREIGIGIVAGGPVPGVGGAGTYTTDFGG